MSLRVKVTLQIVTMLVGALLISAAAVWSINGMEQDYDVALNGYKELREVYGTVGSNMLVAQEILITSPADRDRAVRHLQNARDRFELFRANLKDFPRSIPRDPQAEEAIHSALDAAVAQLEQAHRDGRTESDQSDLDAIDAAMSQTGMFAAKVGQIIRDRSESAAKRRRENIMTITLLGAVVVLGAVVLGIVQYQGVVSPLQKLTDGVRRLAAGEFQQRLAVKGSPEFAGLAGEFNRMAGELDEFYHRLEQKVTQKSRELTRTERLASVGYLAAGVAHEINNPIGIIAGYAEYSLGQLKQQPATAQNEDLSKSLEVICDEAFRCKQIIGQLLSLARPGEGKRGRVDLGKVARDVRAAVGGLRDFKDRNLTVTVKDEEALAVIAAEAEMKQVVLNLTVNALDAVGSGGKVEVEVSRNGQWVELRVRDDGRGMSPETLEHVFEPFYTEKRGAHRPGTGLGLSISNAIIQSHHGHISARSAGVGEGSEFIVQLPAAADAPQEHQA
jgi:two-component system NtrC family sensor kinase